MNKQKGQIGLVVLLIMAVVLTVGVGVASESVMEQKIARQEVESTETFNVAEGAIEAALGQDLSDIEVGSPYATALPAPDGYSGLNLTVTAQDEYSRLIRQGESGQVNLDPGVNHQLVVSWQRPNGGICGTGGEATIPAVIVTLLSATGVERYAYGPSDCGTRGDGFIASILSGNAYSTPAINTTGFSMARIKVVYNTATVSVSGNNLGPQMHEVTSVAEKTSGETRAVQVEKTNPMVPSIFDYAVFAGQNGLAITE